MIFFSLKKKKLNNLLHRIKVKVNNDKIKKSRRNSPTCPCDLFIPSISVSGARSKELFNYAHQRGVKPCDYIAETGKCLRPLKPS